MLEEKRDYYLDLLSLKRWQLKETALNQQEQSCVIERGELSHSCVVCFYEGDKSNLQLIKFIQNWLKSFTFASSHTAIVRQSPYLRIKSADCMRFDEIEKSLLSQSKRCLVLTFKKEGGQVDSSMAGLGTKAINLKEEGPLLYCHINHNAGLNASIKKALYMEHCRIENWLG